jgi:predicted  nucleic acid-binding Zn-ribbon protein
MATKSSAKNTVSVAERLDALVHLQSIDSEIDRLLKVRGELPLEVEDLEDEILGIQKRIANIQSEITELEEDIVARKNAQKDAQTAIISYKEKQNNVRNNREFESLSKEIEYQELEIQLCDKKIKEANYRISEKKEKLEESNDLLSKRTKAFDEKKKELDAIIAETQKDEEKLLKESEKAKKKIDEHLLVAYERLRTNSRNGLAVVPIDRDACGGCFNRIPPQRQLDIMQKKKIIVCEHCGRILTPEPAQ